MRQYETCGHVDPIERPDGGPHERLEERPGAIQLPGAPLPPTARLMREGHHHHEDIRAGLPVAAEDLEQQRIVFAKILTPSHSISTDSDPHPPLAQRASDLWPKPWPRVHTFLGTERKACST